MAWRNKNRDNAPIGQTCPMIDSVLSRIGRIYQDDEPISKADLAELEALMEKIRSANSTLRDWGNEQCNLAMDYEDEVDEERRKNDDLSRQIASLESEIKDLENELHSQNA